jgi:hypothetical protein
MTRSSFLAAAHRLRASRFDSRGVARRQESRVSCLLPLGTDVAAILAKEARAMLIALPAMPEQHTMDGIHLNAADHEVWDKAIVRGIESALCKST